MARWRDGEMVRWRDGEMTRWRDGEMDNANSPGLEIDVRWLCENNQDKCS